MQKVTALQSRRQKLVEYEQQQQYYAILDK